MSERYKLSNNKELNKIAKLAKQKGWRVEKGKGNHILFYPPKGEIVSIASTGSDYRGRKNGFQRLKKAGLDI